MFDLKTCRAVDSSDNPCVGFHVENNDITIWYSNDCNESTLRLKEHEFLKLIAALYQGAKLSADEVSWKLSNDWKLAINFEGVGHQNIMFFGPACSATWVVYGFDLASFATYLKDTLKNNYTERVDNRVNQLVVEQMYETA